VSIEVGSPDIRVGFEEELINFLLHAGL